MNPRQVVTVDGPGYPAAMLEQVALGQARFMTPGIAPDPRGVVIGRYGLMLFPTLEGVVSWLRLYSAESSLDELLPALAIRRVRTPLESREMAVQIPATSSYTLDRASRCARLAGGAIFTGTNKHFVKYRDDRSPYGYDATTVRALPAGVDFMVHGDDFTQLYARDADVAFETLLFRLSPRRIPGGTRLDDDERGELLLAVAPGLADAIVRYLWRNRVSAQVGLARPDRSSAFGGAGSRGFLLARVSNMPERVLDLFIATPGVDVFRPVAANVAVEIGYAHPLDLSSCVSVFDAAKQYLFWGTGDRVDVLAGPIETSQIEHLTDLRIDLERPGDAAEALDALDFVPPDPVGVDIHLAPSLAPQRRVVATLIPVEQAGWLKRLVFLLPQTSLQGHRVAITHRGVLLVASGDIDVVPLGHLLAELAPGLLVPLGMDLVPRIAPDVLARALGHGTGVYTVFPPEGGPFQVSDASLVALERRALAKVEVPAAEAMDARAEPPGDPVVVNDPVGRFALWGFPAPPLKQ